MKTHWDRNTLRLSCARPMVALWWSRPQAHLQARGRVFLPELSYTITHQEPSTTHFPAASVDATDQMWAQLSTPPCRDQYCTISHLYVIMRK